MLSLVVLSLFVASTTSQQSSCRLSDVVTVPNLNEEALAGSWYEVRWYYSDEDEPYENFALSITPGANGINVKEYIREPVGAPCSVYEESSNWRRLRNGVYEYYYQVIGRYARSYIAYTDYDRYLTEFHCIEWEGDICLKPEVSFYFRQPLSMRSTVYPFPENIEEHIQRLNLCVRADQFIASNSREPPCTPVTNPVNAITEPRPNPPVLQERQCEPRKIQVMPNMDERRLIGTWHLMRWYFNKGQEGAMYDSRQLHIVRDQSQAGLYAIVSTRETPSGQCITYDDARRQRLFGKGIYEIYRPDLGMIVRNYIVYTDYDRYLVLATCHIMDGDENCYSQEVSFFSREVLPINRRPGSMFFNDLIQVYKLCAETNRYYKVPSMGTPCSAITRPTTDPRPTQPDPCKPRQVQVMPNLDVRRLTGTWHLMRWYFTPDQEGTIFDSYQLHIMRDEAVPGGLYAIETTRHAPGSTCTVYDDVRRQRIFGNGKYDIYSPDLGAVVRNYVVYTDYDRYLVGVTCHMMDGDENCYEHEVDFLSREVLPINRRPGSVFFNDLIQEYNLCADTNKYYDIPSRGPPCEPRPVPTRPPLPTDRPPVVPPTCACQPYDDELLALMKKKEKAETEKLVVEKEVLELQKQLTSMQISMMQSGLFSPTQLLQFM